MWPSKTWRGFHFAADQCNQPSLKGALSAPGVPQGSSPVCLLHWKAPATRTCSGAMRLIMHLVTHGVLRGVGASGPLLTHEWRWRNLKVIWLVFKLSLVTVILCFFKSVHKSSCDPFLKVITHKTNKQKKSSQFWNYIELGLRIKGPILKIYFTNVFWRVSSLSLNSKSPSFLLAR